MTIHDFAAESASVTPKSDVLERWESRIVAQGLSARGRAGAESYIANYLKGAKAPKVIAFARVSEIKGFPEMAGRFWEEAFFLATGQRASFGGGVVGATVVLPAVALKEGFGRRPQLPVVAEWCDIHRMLLDDAYGVEEKMDGQLAMVDVVDGKVSGGNKKALVKLVQLGAADAIAPIGDAMIDAENVGGIYHAFNVRRIGEDDISHLGYQERRDRFIDATKGMNLTGAFRIIPLVTGRAEKLAFVETLRARRAEGFIIKLLSAPYSEGDSHGHQFKFQFRAVNSFIVGARNGDKDSVRISVLDCGAVRDMGNVKVPASRIPKEGAIVECEYLYVNQGKAGKLHQPVFKGVRDDAMSSDCLFSKLKVKPTEEIDE